MRGRHHRGVVGKAEVIIGAEIDHLPPVGEYHRPLGGTDQALPFEQPGGLECLGIVVEPFAKFLQGAHALL